MKCLKYLLEQVLSAKCCLGLHNFIKTHLSPVPNVPVDVEEIRNRRLDNHHKEYLNLVNFSIFISFTCTQKSDWYWKVLTWREWPEDSGGMTDTLCEAWKENLQRNDKDFKKSNSFGLSCNFKLTSLEDMLAWNNANPPTHPFTRLDTRDASACKYQTHCLRPAWEYDKLKEIRLIL